MLVGLAELPAKGPVQAAVVGPIRTEAHDIARLLLLLAIGTEVEQSAVVVPVVGATVVLQLLGLE